MLDTVKILKAINDKLRELYPNYKVYGVETKEGYKLPCFNTELTVLETENLSSNVVCTPVEITIDFLMQTIDTVLQMKVGDTLRKTFYKYLVVDDRVFHIQRYRQIYTGDYDDIMTCIININLFENLKNMAIDNPITDVDIKIKNK